MFTMVVNRLTERMVFEGAEQKKNRHRLLLLIDEFPSLNRMEIFADALSYMAGYGLKAYLITQDIRQIVDAYGNNESIVSNCHVRIAFAPNQFETAELLSKMTGVTTVPKASYNFSGSRFSPVMQHVNASVDHIERPLMTPDEVLRLAPSRKEGQGLSERIVAPGQMLIFVSGHYPILGTQMLYFLDPFLRARAEVAAPTAFYQIEGDKAIPQKAIDRTPNRISKPEVVPPDTTSMTEGERGFVEELELGFGD
jgi:type IV secretion system protein VirD4